MGGGHVKSDRYTLEKILENFSAEELNLYGDRLVTHPSRITARPEQVKIVCVDDWIISGAQMRNSSSALMLDSDSEVSDYKDRIEVNVVTASGHYIEDGLDIPETGKKIPVRAYFMAHEAPKAGYKAHISGAHSSVDYDFQNTLERMTKGNTARRGVIGNIASPHLVDIVRQYRRNPLPVLSMLQARQVESE